MPIPTTITALLVERAEQHPDRMSVRLHRATAGALEWTYADLERESRRAAAVLASAGVRPGDRVLILAPEIEDAVRALIGTWAVGATPVAVGLPHRMTDGTAFVERLATTAARVEARLLVLGSGITASLPALPSGSPPIVAAAALREGELGTVLGSTTGDGEGCAIVQLSSGTTGRPKGVVLSHRSVLANLAQMQRAFGITAEDVGVSWLPLHHDMGLIGGFLLAVYSGLNGVTLLGQSAFFSQPMIWLRTIAETRATISPAPTAAYALCVPLAARAARAGLDLSSWSRALIGAEPVLSSVMDGFAAAYAPLGFRRSAFVPVYGLAEATLGVATNPLGVGPIIDRVARDPFERCGQAISAAPDALEVDVRTFTSVGAPVDGTRVRIVRDGLVVGERSVGEVDVASPSLMSGYLDEPERTAAVFAREADGIWLHTGDLGYLAEGRLHVTGRQKELIIRAGRNLDPVEVEEVAGAVAGVRTGSVVACGLAHGGRGTEQAVVVAESRREPEEHPALVLAIKNVLREHNLEVDQVRIVPIGWLPWTTSGKRMRTRVRERLLAGDLGPI